MWNARQKKQRPKYSYCRRRTLWAVYNLETGTKVCDYFEQEEARRKVYELNGWKYRKG